MQKKNKSITDICGVYGSACAAGIKKEGLDVAFMYVPEATASAGVFTKNAFAAPCINHNRSIFSSNTVKAVVINSGNANAVTGKQGVENVATTAKQAASLLSLQPHEVAIASTGIIGVQLPMEVLSSGLTSVLANPRVEKGELLAQGILTTDTCSKHCFYEKEVNGKIFQVAGVAKGSGMIEPNMATMLSFIACNVATDNAYLQNTLHAAVDTSFNMISVDSDTSTSDMVLAFASGAVAFSQDQKDECEAFEQLLQAVCRDLALQIVKDGEGSKRTIAVTVNGALSVTDARKIAKSVINSPLVKTAIHGADPNWGRILMAVGKVEHVTVNPEKVGLTFQGQRVLEQGAPVTFVRAELAEKMKGHLVEIEITLGLGAESATAWGCELSKGYVDINTCYN